MSCVEAGRWDGSRHAERMRPSPQAADPDLRRVKRAAAQRGGAADQREVWNEVGARLSHHGVASASAAMSDIYDLRRGDLGSLADALRPVEGQLGAVAAVAGRPVVLDLVSMPSVFALLLPKLAQGYALQALGAPEKAVDPAAAAGFLTEALGAARMPRATPGMGSAMEVLAARVIGRGLEYDGELIQLSAFPAVR